MNSLCALTEVLSVGHVTLLPTQPRSQGLSSSRQKAGRRETLGTRLLPTMSWKRYVTTRKLTGYMVLERRLQSKLR